jgi:hypothetical protein
VEQWPKLEGRQMVMILAPKKKHEAVPKKRTQQQEGDFRSKARNGSATCCTNQGGHHAQDEDQEWRGQALPGPRSGSVKRYQAGKRHILTKRATKNKRQLRGATGSMRPTSAT